MVYVKKTLSDTHKRNIAKALRGRARPIGAGRASYNRSSIMSMVDQGDVHDCWPWRGSTNSGYGRLEIKDRSYYAHRVVYELHNPGAIAWEAPRKRADTGWLLHECDNPICCNPAHLRVGTHKDNMADKAAKGRSPNFQGERGPRAKLTTEDVYWMRIQKRYGATKKALALLYDVSEATVSGALYGRHYQDVQSALG